jgi:EAL domain-containing protein (putative c-di-GMP-specific phosphodiesterase class I)
VQPIVDLRGAAVAGYEVLARFDRPPDEPPNRWIAAAHAFGMGEALEARIFARSVAMLGAHAKDSHEMSEVPPALVDQVRAAIRTVSDH